MSNQGSGIGTPVLIPPPEVDYTLADIAVCALSLPDYVSIIGYDECAFWGVYYDGQIEYDCRMFWTEWQRMDIYRALAEAQRLIEEVVGYPLCRTWITGEPLTEYGEQHYIDKQCYANPMRLRWGHFISAGVRATEVLGEGSPVVYGSGIETVGPLAVIINDPKEVKVYAPGTSREIVPIAMSYAGGNLTIRIPRCRLVAVPNTTDDGVNYDILDNFLSTVDVVRVYNDPSVGAKLVQSHYCDYGCSSTGCIDYTVDACIHPLDRRAGLVDVIPATYSAGVWSRTSAACGKYDMVGLNYSAGLVWLDSAMKSAIVRLAHARMAAEPCGCKIVQALWERDRKTPDVLSRERLNCPFGPSEGAWVAYKYAQSKKRLGMQVW